MLPDVLPEAPLDPLPDWLPDALPDVLPDWLPDISLTDLRVGPHVLYLRFVRDGQL